MSTLREIKVLHLEPTDVCQATCALCARETDADFDQSQQHHLDMWKIMQAFNADRIKELDKMFMCGNYGDPAAGRHTLNIYQQFRKLNPNIVLGMNTNGALRTPEWWEELGRILNCVQDYVVFSIDGLEDTNSVYRQGVDWRKLMQNVESFIRAGGQAHWDMIVYRHNQHQLQTCEQLSRDMGFKWFRAKVSKRGFTDKLQAPIGFKKQLVLDGSIQCHALNEQSAYIDAQGRMHPCCWLGSRQKNFIQDIETVRVGWNTPNCNTVCKQICTHNSTGSNFTNQWHKEIQLSQIK